MMMIKKEDENKKNKTFKYNLNNSYNNLKEG